MTSSFWLILIAVLAYGLLHSFLASLTIKALAHQWLGTIYDRWYRLIYNLIAIISLLPILFLPILLTDKQIYLIPYPWVVLTLIIQLIALIILLIGLRQTGISSFLGLHQLLHSDNTSSPGLTTTGFYRYVRDPLYTAGLVFIWLLPILTWNLLALILGFTLYIFIGALFEERKLVREFGETYVEYRRRTPMLIPGLRFPRSKHPN